MIQAGKTRTKAPEVRRREIIAAASELFLEKGIAETSIGEITQRAGIAKGSFYLHFESKEAVLGALREQFVGGLLDEIAGKVGGRADGDWEGRLDAWVRAALQVCLRPTSIAMNEVLFHGSAAGSMRDDQASHQRGIEDLQALIAAGDAARAWSAPDPRMVAVWLYFAFHGALDDAIARGVLDDAELAPQIVRLFRRALRAE